MAHKILDSVYQIAYLAGTALFFGSGQFVSEAQQMAPPLMQFAERQQYVERVRLAIEGVSNPSPAQLGETTDNRPEELRRDVYALLWRIGTQSRNQPQRTALASHLLSRVSVETPMLRSQLLKWLQDFRRDDFGQGAVEFLNNMSWTAPDGPAVIRLVGIAGVRLAIPRLKAEIQAHPGTLPLPPGFFSGNGWAARLALARLDDLGSLAEVIQLVRGEQNITVRATILFADLGYTRQPAAFNELKSYLNSDKRLPAVKDSVPGRLEAARAAEEFSRHIAGFPIQETDFTELQVFQARSWVNTQNSWHFR